MSREVEVKYSGIGDIREFHTLAPGNLFLVEDKPILKIESVYDRDAEGTWNAVEIQTGTLRFFGKRERVELAYWR